MTDSSRPEAPVIVVMGVSGSGKSTIGALLARDLGVPFTDADDLHPMANIEKMASGVPLDDDDRRPWLEIVGATLAEAADAPGTGLVIACSALKRTYRDTILRVRRRCGSCTSTEPARCSPPAPRGAPGTSCRRACSTRSSRRSRRSRPDEPGIVVDIDRPVGEIIDDAVSRLRAGSSA